MQAKKIRGNTFEERLGNLIRHWKNVAKECDGSECPYRIAFRSWHTNYSNLLESSSDTVSELECMAHSFGARIIPVGAHIGAMNDFYNIALPEIRSVLEARYML